MTKDREPSLADAGHETADLRIADSVESIAGYLREISELLREIAARPETDNAQLTRLANAAAEIERLLPILLKR